MRIGILANGADGQAVMVRDAVERLRPGVTRLFDLSLDGRETVTISADGVSWERLAPDAFDTLYVHGFQYQEPAVPEAMDGADWSLWQAGYVARQQKQSFLYSVLSRMEAGGVRMFNGPAVHLRGFSKPFDLQALEAGGVRLPDWTATNDGDAADRFRARHETVVWRTVTGRCAWQLFKDRQREALISPQAPPVMLAGVAPGRLIRVFVAEGVPVLSLAFDAPNCEALERMELFGALEPDDGTRAIARAVAAAGLRWAMILFVDGDGGPVVYDMDPDPVLGELPVDFQEYLADALARALLGEPLDGLRFGDEELRERKTLFLRRMHRIQFDIEATKYAEDVEEEED